MKIAIDAAICTGHGRCYVVAPELFEPDDEGRGVVRRSDVPPELDQRACTAAASCPERAVELS